MANQQFTWDDVHPGDTIVVQDICTSSSFQIVVRLVKADPGSNFAFVYGKRLTSKGKPSRMPQSDGSDVQPGERREFVLISFVSEIRKTAGVAP